MKHDSSPQHDLALEFEKKRAQYELGEAKVRQLIKDLIRPQNIDIIQVESRTKTVESVRGKLERKPGRYAQLGDLTDLIGIRVIVYYLEDVERVKAFIRDTFAVDDENSTQFTSPRAADRFGYVSEHVVAQIGPDRSKLPEWQMLAGIKFEMQVRTALQHAWAAVSHQLDYKSSVEVPAQLQRKLFRLSALFELADEQFSALQQARTELDLQNDNAIERGQLDLALDRSTFRAFFEKSSLGAGLESLVARAWPGIASYPSPSTGPSHSSPGGGLSMAIGILRDAGIETIVACEQFFDRWNDLIMLQAELFVSHPDFDDRFDLLARTLFALFKFGGEGPAVKNSQAIIGWGAEPALSQYRKASTID